MKGYLIVNSFVRAEKFQELYRFFLNSAVRLNINLEVKRTEDFISDLEEDFKNIALPDFVLFWDKDIYLARRLEKAGIPVFNSSKSIELCDSKILTTLELLNKVEMPKTILVPKTFEGPGYNSFIFLDRAEKIINYPMIIKEAHGSFGKQVYLAENRKEAEEIFTRIHCKDCLIQEFIESSRGKDVRINVVGDRVVASMLRYNDHDYRSNITNGGKMQRYTPSKAQEEIALKACKILNMDFAGVDILFGPDDKPYLCEVNSNPHFKTTYDCTGIDMSELILKHIVEHLKK